MIVGFRNGFGPALMRTQTTLLDAGGQVVVGFETSSMTVRSVRANRLRAISQDTVEKIAAGL